MNMASIIRNALAQLNVVFALNGEKVEAECQGLNDQIEAFFRNGAINSFAILGPVLMDRLYEGAVPPESGQIIQAAIGLPGGLGVVFWDSEVEAMQSKETEDRQVRAIGSIVPVESLSPALRTLLRPHIGNLLVRFVDHLRMIKVPIEGPMIQSRFPSK